MLSVIFFFYIIWTYGNKRRRERKTEGQTKGKRKVDRDGRLVNTKTNERTNIHMKQKTNV